jgi:peptidoglycan/LPS O-acetylase OafA/YrhL
MWTLFYGSNWNLIASAQDYFAQYETISMVRHTWSLAIEEQFYVLWPPVVIGALWLTRGRTRALVGACLFGILTSVALMAILYSPANPSRAYYGTEARVHQLLVGALLAIVLARRPSIRRSGRVGSMAVWVGLGTLLVAFITFDDGNPSYYYGASTALAVAAAVLIFGLEGAPRATPARLLGFRPIRWVGKVSYGVYLWHWPVILAIGAPIAVFKWMPGGLGLTATRVLFTFALAGLSFHFIERPIREGTATFVGSSLSRAAIAIGGATLGVWMLVAALTGSPAEPDFVRGGSRLNRLGCELEICVRHRAPEPGAPVVALIGDSVARSLDVGFVELARREGWTYLVAANDGCRLTHLRTAVDAETEMYEPCYEATPALWEELLETWDPDVVIAFDGVELADFRSVSGEILSSAHPDHLPTERRELEAITERFVEAGTRLVYVALPPVVTPPDCLREDTRELDVCAFPESMDERVGPYNEMLQSVVVRYPGRTFLVSMTPYLCPRGTCVPTVDGVFPRYDGHHFTVEGARWIVPLLRAELAHLDILPSPAA